MTTLIQLFQSFKPLNSIYGASKPKTKSSKDQKTKDKNDKTDLVSNNKLQKSSQNENMDNNKENQVDDNKVDLETQTKIATISEVVRKWFADILATQQAMYSNPETQLLFDKFRKEFTIVYVQNNTQGSISRSFSSEIFLMDTKFDELPLSGTISSITSDNAQLNAGLNIFHPNPEISNLDVSKLSAEDQLIAKDLFLHIFFLSLIASSGQEISAPIFIAVRAEGGIEFFTKGTQCSLALNEATKTLISTQSQPFSLEFIKEFSCGVTLIKAWYNFIDSKDISESDKKNMRAFGVIVIARGLKFNNIKSNDRA